jgi:predicted glycosyltransferase
LIKTTTPTLKIACFVSPHGFGHATRISAVIQELAQSFQCLELIIFGETPQWFWENNLPKDCKFRFCETETDIGLVQNGPFLHDSVETLKKVNQFLKFPSSELEGPIKWIRSFEPAFILCDISPLGIEIGSRLSIPTLLLENFTWDWIYQSLIEDQDEYKHAIEILSSVYAKVSLRLQCMPCCEESRLAKRLNPIFRSPSLLKSQVLEGLGLEEEDSYILVTTGGIPMAHTFKNPTGNPCIVIPGDFTEITKKDSIIHLPMNSRIPFPDLVNASSLVVGKAGYGTIAECWGMDIPFLGVFRDTFRESNILRHFCKQEVNFKEITLPEFNDSSWMKYIPDLLGKKISNSPVKRNGAKDACAQIIHFLNELLRL